MLSQSTPGPFTGGVIDSVDTLHDVMKFMPFNRRTLTAMRCVSKPFRSAVQRKDSPWAGNHDIMLSKYGQSALFNAQEDDEGRSDFQLNSISPIGRKMRTTSMRTLARYNALVANGLSKLVLHHSLVDNSFFEELANLKNLKELELVSCRSVTSVSEASRIKSLEALEVWMCPLDASGVSGLALPALKKLNIRSCHNLSNFNEIAAETATSLRELYIESCDVYDDTVGNFFAHFGQELEVLHLSCTHVNAALLDVPVATRQQSLKTVRLDETPVQDETLAEFLVHCEDTLEFLSIDKCVDVVAYDYLGKLKALRFLDISGASCSDGMSELENCREKLEFIRMVDAKIEDISFLSDCPNLRVLDARSSSLTDSSLEALRGLPQLEAVVLTDCVYISNVNVLASCPNILRIFCARTSLTNDGIVMLKNCEKLEELDVKMTSVTDCTFMLQCRTLKSINVTGNDMDNLTALLARSSLQVLCDTDEFMDA